MNRALVKKHVELKWDFSTTLSHVFELPASLEQLRAIGLAVVWGEVRVTPETLGLAVSFRADMVRAAAEPPAGGAAAEPPAGDVADSATLSAERAAAS